MSVPDNTSNAADTSDRLGGRPRSDDKSSANSKLFEHETYPLGASEYYDNYEYYEDGFEVYKNKKEQYQRSISILEEETYPENELTIDEAKACLSRIGEVGTGLMYAFTQIDVDHRYLTNIEAIANFKYLSIINVSYNHLDLNGLNALRDLEYVVEIRADHNVVQSLCLSPMPYLQVLTLNSNKVSSLSGLKQPSLECLQLNDNQISYLIQESSENVDGNKIDCPNLSSLTLLRNALETVEQIMFVSVKLRILCLSYNKIHNLNGLEYLSNLSCLHLCANRVASLDGFSDNLKHLSYLNLSENHLRDFDELTKLVCLKSLKTLVVSHNKFGMKPNVLKSKIIKMLPSLERIDEDMVSEIIPDDGSDYSEEVGEEQ